MTRRVYCADLFCGAGGTTTGLWQAAQGLGLDVRLVVVNHWDRAIETHAHNYPWAEHYCTGLGSLKPSKAVPGHRLDLLVASPECTHHSVARGGKPMDDQSRSSAWHVLHWCQELNVRNVIIENVPEFTQWGPLDVRGRPMQSRRGDTFRAFLAAMQSLGYRLDWRFLTAADYGDATTRRRFFLLATRGRRALSWPAASHMAQSPGGLPLGLPAWRPAREVIDWSIPGHSIFLDREEVRRHGLKIQRPLKPNTMRRIEAGIRKFWGEWAEPFLVLLRGTEDGQIGRSAIRLDKPLPALTAGGGHVGLVQPLIMPVTHGSDTSSRTRGCASPLASLTAAHGGELAVLRPLMVRFNGSHAGRADGDQRSAVIDLPLGAQDCSNRYGLLQPFILNQDQRGRDRLTGEPLPTLTTKSAHGLVQPFLVKYNRTGQAYSVEEPLQSITTDDRFGLVRPFMVEAGGERWLLDILFRMLTVKELAAAHSFPADYWFAGNKSEQVKQIGNSVPVATAQALARAALLGEVA